LLRDTNDSHPLAVTVNAVVDDLVALECGQLQMPTAGTAPSNPSWDYQSSGPLYVQVTHTHVLVALKNLDRSSLVGIKNVPVVDGVLGDQTQLILTNPLPEDDIFVHGSRLELLLCLEVKDLQCSRLCAQSDDLSGPVHDGTVGLDGASDDIVAVLEVDNDNFGLGGFALLLSYANEGVGL
jgi:hypothetical protein